MEHFVNIKASFSTGGEVRAPLLPRVLGRLLICDSFVRYIGLIPRNHDWDLLGKILPQLADPLIHLLEGVRVRAIVHNDSP